MHDRRAKTRINVCFEARWSGSSDRRPDRITDLSEEGCYLDTIGEVLSGQVISLQVLLPNGSWLSLRGEVAHNTRRLGFGLRFLGLSEETKAQVRKLIAEVLEQELEERGAA